MVKMEVSSLNSNLKGPRRGSRKIYKKGRQVFLFERGVGLYKRDEIRR